MKSGAKKAVETPSNKRSRDENVGLTSSKQKRCKAVDLSRANLVGKFPHIQHQPVPKARCRLSKEVRDKLVAMMVLK